jgi:hypothetical protein
MLGTNTKGGTSADISSLHASMKRQAAASTYNEIKLQLNSSNGGSTTGLIKSNSTAGNSNVSVSISGLNNNGNNLTNNKGVKNVAVNLSILGVNGVNVPPSASNPEQPASAQTRQLRQNLSAASYMNMVPASQKKLNSSANVGSKQSNGGSNYATANAALSSTSPAVLETSQDSFHASLDTNNRNVLQRTNSFPSSKSGKRVRFSENLTTEVEISTDIYMLPGQSTAASAGGFVNNLKKAIIKNNNNNNNSNNSFDSSSMENVSSAMNGYETINNNIPYTNSMLQSNSLVAKKGQFNKRASTPLPTRPSLSEQLGAITAQASAITLDLKKRNPGISGSASAGSSTLIFTCPVKDLVIGSLHSKYPSPVSFYNDHLEYVFHHPFAALEVTMVMYYKDMSSTSLLVGLQGAKFSFKILKKMAAFPSTHDYDPSNPIHAVVIEFATLSTAQDMKDKIIPLLRK